MPHISLPRYVYRVKRRGREYFYYHPGRGTDRAGTPVRLPDDPRTPEWWSAYRLAAGIDAPPRRDDTFDALTARYLDAATNGEAGDWSKATRRQYARHMAKACMMWGPLPVRGITLAAIRDARDAMAATPHEANGFLRSMSAFLSWCVAGGEIDDNPASRVKKLKARGEWEPWSADLLARAPHELPDHIWRVCAVALYTGQREGDVLRMGRTHVRNGEIRVVQEKTGHEAWIPVHPDLAPLLDVSHDATTILVNSRGRPWTSDGFRASFATAKKAAGWTERATFHGLRKNAVIALLDVGCTTAQVAAITRQSMQMVEHYARRRDQRKLAQVAMGKWVAGN
jgi:integrase